MTQFRLKVKKKIIWGENQRQKLKKKNYNRKGKKKKLQSLGKQYFDEEELIGSKTEIDSYADGSYFKVLHRGRPICPIEI